MQGQLVAILLTLSPAVHAHRDAFEVASIKENTEASASPSWVMSPGGEVRITNYRLLPLIAIAYDSSSIQTRNQITGGPAEDGDIIDVSGSTDDSFNPDCAQAPTTGVLVAVSPSPTTGVQEAMAGEPTEE